jgi:Gpi18-like mannosyltransferase
MLKIAKLRQPLKRMPLLVLLMLVLLSILTSSVAFFSNSETKVVAQQLNGVIPSAVNDYGSNGNNILNVTNQEISIESLSSSNARVNIYSSTTDFNWTFSVIPERATGGYQVAKFWIDWGYGAFLVWAQQTDTTPPDTVWVSNTYNYSDSSVNIPNDVTLLPGFSKCIIGETYKVTINWREISNTVKIIFSLSGPDDPSISNTFNFSLPVNRKVDYSSLYFGENANATGTASSRYKDISFSYSSSKFNSESSYGRSILIVVTLAILVITVVALVEKLALVKLSFKQNLVMKRLAELDVERFGEKTLSFFKRFWIIMVILLFFASLRFFIAIQMPGHIFDTYTVQSWMGLIHTKGVLSIYSGSDILASFYGLRPVFPYPPLISYILAVLPSLPSQANLVSIIAKFPGIAGDLLLGVTIFAVLRKKGVISIALPALVLSLLNFVDSAIWGQYDSLLAAFLVLAVWLVITKRLELGWLFMGLAFCTKQTSLIILPVLLLLSIKTKAWSRVFYSFLIFFAITFIIWYPFLANGYSFDFAMGTAGLRLWAPGGGLDPVSPEGGGGTSIWAFNIWPLITSGQATGTDGITGAVKDTVPNQLLGFLSYYELGMVLFGLAYIVIAIRLWKTSSSREVIMQTAVLLFAFFMLPTRVHERYLVFALSFLPLAYTKSKAFIVSYLLLLTTFSLNLIYCLGSVSRSSYPQFLGGFFADTTYPIAISALNTVIFLIMFLPKTSWEKIHSIFSRSRKL